jgi:hypothetical protein
MSSTSRERSGLSREVHELERVADTGGSSATPLILLGEVWVVCAVAVVTLIALALLAYRLAS